jgi:hypothetical protein
MTKTNTNWREFIVPSHRVLWVKDDPETGGSIVCVDIERPVTVALQDQKAELLEKMPKRKGIGLMMNHEDVGFNDCLEIIKEILNKNEGEIPPTKNK